MPSRSRSRRALAALLGWTALCLLLSVQPAHGSNFVTVRAWADPGYLAQKAGRNSSAHETYVAAQGEYFDCDYRDPSISEKSLGAILRFLAPTLTKQGYYPAKDIKSAVLLLVVHWGTTMGRISEYAQIESTLPNSPEFRTTSMGGNVYVNDFAPPTGMVMAPDYSDEHYSQAYTTQIASETARSMTTTSAEGLLGYSKQLFRERQRLVSSEVQRTLEANLLEDRYFVILQAYDFQKLQKGEGRKLLWSVHMSMRAPGLNFTLALPRMGQIAAALYGQSNDEVVTGKAERGPTTTVEVGPLTVLSQSAATEPKK